MKKKSTQPKNKKIIVPIKLKKKIRVGLALGGGSARGLAHIGVLNILHKNKIYPDYIAGTSMGAVIGALYAAGHAPKEIEKIAKSAHWKKLADFTIPKSGLLEGLAAEQKIRGLVDNKKFSELDIPLRVVSYNLNQKQKVIFHEGDVAKAVHASMCIPGVFAPVRINNEDYIDGGVIDPTPFDIVKEMGADIIIAIDLYTKSKTVKGPALQEKSLGVELREKFIAEELLNIKNYIIPQRWPKFLRKIFAWGFDKLLYPAKVIKIMAGKELPQITKVMYSVVGVLINNLAMERFKNAKIDVKVTPIFSGVGWSDFNKVTEFVRIGETAMNEQMKLLKEKLGK